MVLFRKDFLHMGEREKNQPWRKRGINLSFLLHCFACSFAKTTIYKDILNLKYLKTTKWEKTFLKLKNYKELTFRLHKVTSSIQ